MDEDQYVYLTSQIEGSRRILIALRTDPLTNKIIVELATTASYVSNAASSSYSTQTQFTGSFTGSFFGPAAAFAWGNWSAIGTTITNNQSYNATVSRLGVGRYTFTFTKPPSRVPYSVVVTAGSASTNTIYNIAPTGSICTPFNLSTAGFTASIVLPAPLVIPRNDPMSGSFVCYAY